MNNPNIFLDIWNFNSTFLFWFVEMDLLKMALVILSDSDAVSSNFFRGVILNTGLLQGKICYFRLYSESEASRTLWGIHSDLFSAQNNVVGFGWYRVTRGSPKLVLAAVTRSNFRPKKPCNFKLALILELVLCIRSFEEFNTSLLRFAIRSIPLGTWFLSCFLGD